MDKPKPQITQTHKTPSRWDILKTKAKYTKEYLKGQIIKGTETTASSKIAYHREKIFTDRYRIIRKRKNKLKYRSRRKNRSGL